MPKSGYILDLGCGFGLFTLYYAAQNPNVRVIGIDISSTRIEMAKKSAQKLGIRNVEFLCLNATKLSDLSLKFDIVVALDVLHHLPVQDGNKIIEIIYQTKLSNGGSFILKDITTHPRYMLYFTFILDLLMNPKDSFYYRSTDAWITCFKNVGFCQVEKHYLWDILPYPHILLLARKPDS
jgi:2-polyprenyl-3-methyl-5-hydroxy-6-metoxy-1,4-benzoquinol methylase